MRGVGKALFSGSRFVRWTLLPCIALSALVLGLDSSSWTPENAGKFAGIELGHVLLFLAIGWPERFRWAGRVLGAVVFLACAAFLVRDLTKHPVDAPGTETDVWRGVKAMLVFGVPSLWYAARGRFGFGESDALGPDSATGGRLPVLPKKDLPSEPR